MSTHQPYNAPNTIVGTPYQHWLDDAAQMGLMLFRMRQDSRRERLLDGRHRHRRETPDPKPVVIVATPRTSAALQIPTVATETVSPPPNIIPPRPQPLYQPPLD